MRDVTSENCQVGPHARPGGLDPVGVVRCKVGGIAKQEEAMRKPTPCLVLKDDDDDDRGRGRGVVEGGEGE